MHALGESTGVERGVELRAVEPDARGILLQLVRLQSRLVAEEQRSVLPILALLARGLCGFGRLLRVCMLRERIVAYDQAHALAVLGRDSVECWLHRGTRGALIVRELHERHKSLLAS